MLAQIKPIMRLRVLAPRKKNTLQHTKHRLIARRRTPTDRTSALDDILFTLSSMDIISPEPPVPEVSRRILRRLGAVMELFDRGVPEVAALFEAVLQPRDSFRLVVPRAAHDFKVEDPVVAAWMYRSELAHLCRFGCWGREGFAGAREVGHGRRFGRLGPYVQAANKARVGTHGRHDVCCCRGCCRRAGKWDGLDGEATLCGQGRCDEEFGNAYFDEAPSTK